jgi:hypothetical protein
MKTLLFLSVLFLGFNGFGQGYAPFNENNPKRFQDVLNTNNNEYFFYPIEIENNADTTTFHQYLSYSSVLVDVTGTICEGWGGQLQPAADTTWLGRLIKYITTTQELIITNADAEQLTFDFGINIGDSSVFYSNVDHYYLRYDNLAQELVIDSLNWVKTFTIWKYDSFGNAVSSALNGFEIKLSEQLGLVSFIDCDNFPTSEKGFTLMGQLNPTIGYYQLTYDEIFPWNPGDTLEVKGTNYKQSWGMITRSHKLITIQNRIETSDSVWIYLNIEEQIDESAPGAPFTLYPYNIGYTNPIVFKKGSNISPYPHNSAYGTISFFNDSVNYCGPRKGYGSYEAFNIYCDSCDCFIPFDGNGQYVSTYEYTEGLGMTFSKIQQYGNWVDETSAELIYSNIGGIQ